MKGHASGVVVALEPRPSTRTRHVIAIDSGEEASATASHLPLAPQPTEIIAEQMRDIFIHRGGEGNEAKIG